MDHYGILRNSAVSETAEDIRGSHLYGTNDEKLGKIDDVIFNHSSGDIRYVVVDTGGWLSSKKFIVPAERLHASSKHNDDFEVNLTKQQVENFPPYNESDLHSESNWNTYEGKYRAKWVADPVIATLRPQPTKLSGTTTPRERLPRLMGSALRGCQQLPRALHEPIWKPQLDRLNGRSLRESIRLSSTAALLGWVNTGTPSRAGCASAEKKRLPHAARVRANPLRVVGWRAPILCERQCRVR